MKIQKLLQELYYKNNHSNGSNFATSGGELLKKNRKLDYKNKLTVFIDPKKERFIKPECAFVFDLNGKKFQGNLKRINRKNKTLDIELVSKIPFKVFEAEYNGEEVELNQPEYDYDSKSHKFRVYVSHPKTGEIVKVGFGSPDMEIKRDDKERRKSFRARHKCDKWNFYDHRHTARYWSCQMWQAGTTVSDLVD